MFISFSACFSTAGDPSVKKPSPMPFEPMLGKTSLALANLTGWRWRLAQHGMRNCLDVL
jgi:hypothetical protein